MISGKIYNNIGIESIALMLVLQKMKEKSLSKIVLILPIIAHKELLSYLANGNVEIQSFERLLIEKISFFSNFNRRFYDNLCGSLNALQFLHEIELVEVTGSEVKIRTEMAFEDAMGGRAKRIHKAAKNIAKILEDEADKLYLNLRIEL